jgi:outer membrane protein, heavy metal efflux system
VVSNPRLNRRIGITASWLGHKRTTELVKVLMRRQSLWLVLVFWAWSGQAIAQGPTLDTGVPALPGSSNSLLGRAPGSGGSALSGNLPGSAAILGGRPGVSTPKGIPTSLANPGAGAGPTDLQMPIRAPQPEPVTSSTTPLYGTLEIPAGDDDGPPEGLTLDHAIDITLERSLDLRSKFFEIPMARADTLQANLRSNPIFYQDGQLLQYKGSPFNRAAPGGPQQFDTNVTYPLDISHKRQARTVVATRAERVLEAQYQDAVRQRIDDIFGAFVTALAARQTLRYARTSVGGLEKLADQTERLFNKGGVSRGDFNRVKIQLQTTRLGRVDAEAAYRKAKLDLGSLMNLKLDEIEKLELRGTIADVAPPPPRIAELAKIAVAERPDVVSLRLGIERAVADVRLAKANAYSDVYVLWQPYTFQDNSPFGLKSQTSWALGVTVPLPIYNRNQGGIERAKLNVTQTQHELADLERQARIDVEQAVQEYEVTRQLVNEFEDRVLPEARQARDEALRLLVSGDKSIPDFIIYQRDYNQIVKQYLDTAVRHRRSMLSLNTVVGRKIMP